MSYSDFTLTRALTDFGLTVETRRNLFGHVAAAPLDVTLQRTLEAQLPLALAINTEKARSEWLIAPLLAELWRRGDGRVAVFSGVPFDVDADAGLVGRSDFLIGRPPQLHFVTAPIVVIVEAKNEDIAGGLGQCAAAMVAAQRFNQRAANDIDTVYGCVSDGSEWKFLQLHGATLTIDLVEYHISQADRILGILLHMVGLPPGTVGTAA
jgi:hypothetical protein